MGLEADVKPTRVVDQHEALVSRIANALEALANISAANYDLAEKIANEQTSHNAETQRILTEDLAFRREQAEKSEQQQATFLQMFLGAAQPHATPLETKTPGGVADFRVRRKRKVEAQ